MTVYVVTYGKQYQRLQWKGKTLKELHSELRKRFERWNGTLVQVFDTSLANWIDLDSEEFATMVRVEETKIELRLVSLTLTSKDPIVCPYPPSFLPKPRPRARPSTTMKYRKFMGEPMGGGTVGKLPGIGPVSGERLRRAGFGKAEKVFSQFLMLERNETRFVEWLAHKSKAQPQHLKTCFDSLNEWYIQHMA